MTSLRRSSFFVPKMDCPAEEVLVRTGEPALVLGRLDRLALGARITDSCEGELPADAVAPGAAAETSTLRILRLR